MGTNNVIYMKNVDPKEFVKFYCIKSLVCSFSGGRSSLVMTHYVLNQINDKEVDKYVVFVDTGVMLPDAIDFVKNIAKTYNWPLKILKPKTDFWQYATRYGTPSIKRRWCCKYLKLQPIYDFIKALPPQRANLIGYRKDEVERRRKLPQVWYHKKTLSWTYYPIKTWTKKDVLNYLKANNLPTGSWYKIGLKETCICGAYARQKEWMIIKAYYPQLYNKFVELEKVRLKWGRTAFHDKKPLSAIELAKQRILDDYT